MDATDGGQKRSVHLIELDAIIVAYAMSRFDKDFLQRFSFNSWREAFHDTGCRLGVRPASMKNLRDEFDPIHPNERKGWHMRPLRPNRQRVLAEFCEASDEALAEVVSRLLRGDQEVEEVVTKPLAAGSSYPCRECCRKAPDGALAEEYFLGHSERICGLSPSALVDYRFEACGFDFGVKHESRLAIEVKGIKASRGDILFTDCEWRQAARRKADYWLVVVGALDNKPRPLLVKHPYAALDAISSIRHSAVVSWRASVAVP